MMTKSLPIQKLEICRIAAGLVEPPHIVGRGRFVGSVFPPM
jgi:hypothetical protein